MSTTTAELVDRIQARRELPSPAMQRALRKAAGASLAEVAEAVGVTRQAVSMWELGQRSPRAHYLDAYLEVQRAFRRAMTEDLSPEKREPGFDRAQGSRDQRDESAYHRPPPT